jgi:DmsE family decaheme c-type cytochrome
MGRRTRPFGIITAAIGLWIAVMVTISVAAAPRQNATAPAKATATATKAAPTTGYVGEDTCLTCHEDQKKGYHGSPHSRAANPRSPVANKGCESCHGPGQAHVDGGGDKTKILNPKTLTPREASDVCLSCHNRSGHNDWSGGKHDSRNVSCVTCHSIHQPKSETKQLKTETIEETCVQCHRTQVNKVDKSSHMPVGSLNGNKMQCTTCHNPHGSQNVKMLREGNSVNEACTTCHAEKRGPYLWDHQVTRESCTTCHDAHGSNNERMLVAKEPMLCQRCHVSSRHPATIYDQTQVNTRSNRVIGRSCTQCHSQIHGSNHPSGNFFLR